MNRLAGLELILSPSTAEVAEVLAVALHQRRPIAVDVETPEERNNVIELCGLASSPRHGLVFEWREPYIELMRRYL